MSALPLWNPSSFSTTLLVLELQKLMELPYITSELPGIGGQLRAHPEHFVVDEIALYEPSGEGQHLYVNITKVGLTTKDVQRKLVRLFNLREGLTAEQDTLPARFTTEPLPDGPRQGATVDVGEMVQTYYKLRGWTEDGKPTRELLDRLEIAAEL